MESSPLRCGGGIGKGFEHRFGQAGDRFLAGNPLALVGNNTGIISSRGNKFWGFDVFKDTFRDDLQDFRQSGIRTIGGDKTAQRTVIRLDGLFQLADGVGRKIDRFGCNGIIIAVGRS